MPVRSASLTLELLTLNLITVDELRKLMPTLSLAKAAAYLPHLQAAMLEQGICSKPRRCAFLAQLAHESAGLRYMEEIASGAAYEGRKDLGNIKPGDGKRYKGRGPIQLTGRANYRRFGFLLDLDLEANPQLAAKPENGFRIAACFWAVKGLNELADKLSMNGDAAERQVFMEITKKINGGLNGLSDRLNYFRVAKQVLHPDPSEVQETATESESPAEVSTDTGLLDVAVNSSTLKGAGKHIGPRIAKHSSAAISFALGLYEAHKMATFVVVLVLLAGLGWLVYHNRKPIKGLILKHLK